MNTGVKAARGEIILTTDLSCRAVENWISTVVETFSDHPKAGCVAGDIKLLRMTEGVVIDFQECNNYMSPMLALKRTTLPFMPFADGANASFRKCVFDEIGGFEESFLKAADVEICYRMFVLTDYTLVFNRSAIMWEPGEPSLRALLHQRFRMGIGWNLLQMKYPVLFETMRPDARAWAADHFEKFLHDERNFMYQPVLKHGDFGPSNILFDPASGCVRGILDFGSAGLGDPAYDFAGLLSSYGEGFVRRCARVYPELGGFLPRVRFYQGTFALYEALFGVEHGDEAAYRAGMARYV